MNLNQAITRLIEQDREWMRQQSPFVRYIMPFIILSVLMKVVHFLFGAWSMVHWPVAILVFALFLWALWKVRGPHPSIESRNRG
jgi:hypothetical protein